MSPDKADATVKTGGKSGAFLAHMNIGSGTSIAGVDLDHRNRSLKWAYCPAPVHRSENMEEPLS